MSDNKVQKTVAIAGASGFIGSALMERIKAKHNIIGLSRSKNSTQGGIEWRSCDLFSLKEAELGLKGADVAIYLVHSMMPSAKMTQGRFDDLDLIIADNFARAAKAAGVKRIIYLGGLIPNEKLSLHLTSRLEVEDALGEQQIPCISLRAGLVVGPHGSSFDMMRKLVERLPVMICPGWTSTKTQPVALSDVTEVIARVIDDEELPAGSYDLGGPDVMTYIDMMRETARQLGKRRFFLPIFLFSPKLSRLWVKIVTGAPKELISPLVESLKHTMVARDTRIMSRYGIATLSFQDALGIALTASDQVAPSSVSPKHLKKHSASVTDQSAAHQLSTEINTVCSVQRLPLPKGSDADWVATSYASWLIDFLYPLIKVIRDQSGSLKFMIGIGKMQLCLLKLDYAADRSSAHRQLFYIQGGALLSSKSIPKGRLEFREVLAGRYVMAAIFDYVPALPWRIYKATQALVHLFVMASFKNYLKKMTNS